MVNRLLGGATQAISVKWFGRNKQTSALAAQLADYPAYMAPHTGNHLSFTDAQALENLAYLQSVRTTRINHLHELLAHYEIALKPALANGHHKLMIEQLYRWAQSEWALTVPAEIATRKVWRTTNRQADQIIYSVVMDCAIALGDIVIHQRPAYQWAVDLDTTNCDDQMPSARRVILQAPSLLHGGQMVIVDWEELVVAMLLKPQSTANRAINLWLRMCDEAISGIAQGEHI